MANKLELVSSGGIPHCYNHNVYCYSTMSVRRRPGRVSLAVRRTKNGFLHLFIGGRARLLS